MKQEVRIQLDVSVTIDVKYTTKELDDMIRRAAGNFMPNNFKSFHCLRYAEESQLYCDEPISWSAIFP